MEDLICSNGLYCCLIGLLRQQQFIPHPEFAITPVAIKLAPKVRAKPMQMALRIKLFPEARCFIVKWYTLKNFALSTDIDKKLVTPTERPPERTNTNVKVLYKNGDRIYIYTQIRQLPETVRWQGLTLKI